jgi:hypothetical protein
MRFKRGIFFKEASMRREREGRSSATKSRRRKEMDIRDTMQMETAIDDLLRKTQMELLGKSETILGEFAMDAYTDAIKHNPDFVAFIVKDICAKILRKYNHPTLALYQRLSLLVLMKQSLKALQCKRLPGTIVHLCMDWFERAIANLVTKPDAYYLDKSEPFIDELCCCSFRTIPIGGAWMIETSAVRKKLLVTGGVRQFLSFLMFIILKVGGFKPVYRIHMLKRYPSGAFSPEERAKCYLRIADLLRQYNKIKGMYAIGWLYDPKLSEVSPSLAFLREVPEKNGAKLFRFGTTEEVIKLGTGLSKERRRLYEEGKYTPTEYALVWPKKEMLAWAERELKNHGSTY